MAPFCLLVVAFILLCFRSIYGEAVTALPVNGGAYNILLNTTSKQVAALAACLTMLSYIATGVVSGADAMLYLKTLWSDLPVEAATIVVLAIFAALTIWGIGESAVVALAIFIGHLITLLVLVVVAIIFAAKHGPDTWNRNFAEPFPEIKFEQDTISKGGAAGALFFGTSAALLGISGFESSANYVEDQAPGVFVLTLRNMWIAVSFFNPLLSFLSLAVMPMKSIRENNTHLLAEMAHVVGGQWLKTWVVVDAVIVLSGAVLTAYVGVTGLIRRMALDRCLPDFLLSVNSCRGTNHWIILGFFGVASSLYLLLNGNVETLSGVYNLSFLSVMALFAVGTMLLKWKRPHLPRDVESNWAVLFLALALVVAGLVGNILRNPTVPQYFMIYFGCTVAIVAVMFQRTFLLRLLLASTRSVLSWVLGCHNTCQSRLEKSITEVNASKIVFFTKDDDLVTMNKAILYVRSNEQTSTLLMVHCYSDERPEPEGLRRNIALLDQLYPKLRVDLVLVKGDFGPHAIEEVSAQFGVEPNMMFISCPDAQFPFKLNALGGVRIITTGARSLTEAAAETNLGGVPVGAARSTDADAPDGSLQAASGAPRPIDSSSATTRQVSTAGSLGPPGTIQHIDLQGPRSPPTTISLEVPSATPGHVTDAGADAKPQA